MLVLRCVWKKTALLWFRGVAFSVSTKHRAQRRQKTKSKEAQHYNSPAKLETD